MHPKTTAAFALGLSVALAGPAAAQFHFDSGQPDSLIATASRLSSSSQIGIETADDFIVPASGAQIDHATFYGLIPLGVTLSDVAAVGAEIYRVFPNDSTVPPSGNVPTRVNSPSDVAFAERDSGAANLTFSASFITGSFTAGNSVLNGIHPVPGETTLGDGPVTGQEVLFDVSFSPISLATDHYFFVPQVALSTGDFYWLSAPKPITGAGTTPFTPDLQSWIRNDNLAPDWLRVGTDIVGGFPAPTFNMAFTLDGKSGTSVPDAASTGWLLGAGALAVVSLTRRSRRPAA